MRILSAFLCMGMICAVAVVVVAVQAVIRLLPLIIAAVLVLGAVRWWQQRRAPAMPELVPPAQAIPQHPVGWVMVPVWRAPGGQPQAHPVIDGEVISEDGDHLG